MGERRGGGSVQWKEKDEVGEGKVNGGMVRKEGKGVRKRERGRN